MDRSEGVPSDTYAGVGNRGQYLVIIPSLDMVIVRRGFDTADGGRFDVAAFTRDVIAAINQAHTDRLDAQAEATAAEAGYN